MMQRIFPILLLLLGGIVLTAGDIVMKEWVKKDKTPVYILGMVIYLIGLNFLAQSFKYKNIAVASVMFVIFNVVTLSIVSWFMFNEKLSPMQVGGIMLGLISIGVLEMARS